MEDTMSTATSSTRDPLRRLKDLVDAPERHPGELAGFEDPRLLGMILDGASPAAMATVAIDAVGYGSRIVVEDMATGEASVHHLMSSDAMDLALGHISFEAPLGSALLGHRVSDVVEVTTPTSRRALRIRELRTLTDLLDALHAGG